MLSDTRRRRDGCTAILAVLEVLHLAVPLQRAAAGRHDAGVGNAGHPGRILVAAGAAVVVERHGESRPERRRTWRRPAKAGPCSGPSTAGRSRSGRRRAASRSTGRWPVGDGNRSLLVRRSRRIAPSNRMLVVVLGGELGAPALRRPYFAQLSGFQGPRVRAPCSRA